MDLQAGVRLSSSPSFLFSCARGNVPDALAATEGSREDSLASGVVPNPGPTTPQWDPEERSALLPPRDLICLFTVRLHLQVTPGMAAVGPGLILGRSAAGEAAAAECSMHSGVHRAREASGYTRRLLSGLPAACRGKLKGLKINVGHRRSLPSWSHRLCSCLKQIKIVKTHIIARSDITLGQHRAAILRGGNCKEPRLPQLAARRNHRGRSG